MLDAILKAVPEKMLQQVASAIAETYRAMDAKTAIGSLEKLRIALRLRGGARGQEEAAKPGTARHERSGGADIPAEKARQGSAPEDEDESPDAKRAGRRPRGEKETKASSASQARKQVGQQTGARRRTAAEEEQDERIRQEDDWRRWLPPPQPAQGESARQQGPSLREVDTQPYWAPDPRPANAQAGNVAKGPHHRSARCKRGRRSSTRMAQGGSQT